MAEQTIYVIAKTAVTASRVNGNNTNQNDIIGNALKRDAFSWENPYNLALTFGAANRAIPFDDADGVLSDDPFTGAAATDQKLTQPVTINGVTYTPSTGNIRWANPAPVSVENEYEVTLFDSTSVAYRMVGVSITKGYSTTVVGVMFDSPSPAAGTTLSYKQGCQAMAATVKQSQSPLQSPAFWPEPMSKLFAARARSKTCASMILC